MILGLRQAKTISQFATSDAQVQDVTRVSRMLKMEGTFFLILLGMGGVTLAILSYRDYKRALLITDFFSTVTHEMKTPIATLQLQVEGLLNEEPAPEVSKKLQKILKENRRIESRMDKAFYLASLMQGEGLFIESVSILSILDSLKTEFPLKIQEPFIDELVKADRKAVESIFLNLFENSLRHGKASQIIIQIEKTDQEEMLIKIQDDGIGFSGNKASLTVPFKRHSTTSGTGIGLYIAKKLMDKMSGFLKIHETHPGFSLTLGFKLS
ncbi:GHKL domain protein [Leptospira ryugenii]|uniref:histidine kinase n=2 Tax=Leptospira ryugenii TaxID=1917863 RepID=A0A2P2DXZ5_9LEPT|nr:GHKL domain protein [Leptospira ryugenii]